MLIPHGRLCCVDQCVRGSHERVKTCIVPEGTSRATASALSGRAKTAAAAGTTAVIVAGGLAALAAAAVAAHAIAPRRGEVPAKQWAGADEDETKAPPDE